MSEHNNKQSFPPIPEMSENQCASRASTQTANPKSAIYTKSMISKHIEHPLPLTFHTKHEVRCSKTNNIHQVPIYTKESPLLTPNLFLTGYYRNKTDGKKEAKLACENNSAYVEALFYYLSSRLIRSRRFFHAIDFYGECVGIAEQFTYDCEDERPWLERHSFFNDNVNKLFSFGDQRVHVSEFQPWTNETVDDILQIDGYAGSGAAQPCARADAVVNPGDVSTSCTRETSLMGRETPDSGVGSGDECSDTCSDAGSHESSVSSDESVHDFFQEIPNASTNDLGSEASRSRGSISSYDAGDDIGSFCSESAAEYEENNIHIFQYPVQYIHIEKCQCTLSDLMVSDNWAMHMIPSMLFQIAASLLMYQTEFQFTHNDLHTSNIMCNKTDEPFIYYTIQGQVYKVPTHGYIYKIIDFGRSIFTWNGRTYYSDEYAPHENATTVYNSEPYYNSAKPKCNPNFAFDLCYLAVNLYLTILPAHVPADQHTPIQSLLTRWVTDVYGNNIVRSKTGVIKNDGIKLYKVIARHISYPVPGQVIQQEPLFRAFVVRGRPVEPHVHIQMN